MNWMHHELTQGALGVTIKNTFFSSGKCATDDPNIGFNSVVVRFFFKFSSFGFEVMSPPLACFRASKLRTWSATSLLHRPAGVMFFTSFNEVVLPSRSSLSMPCRGGGLLDKINAFETRRKCKCSHKRQRWINTSRLTLQVPVSEKLLGIHSTADSFEACLFLCSYAKCDVGYLPVVRHMTPGFNICTPLPNVANLYQEWYNR